MPAVHQSSHAVPSPHSLRRTQDAASTAGWTRRDWRRRRLLAAADVVSLFAALLAGALVADQAAVGDRLAIGVLTLPAWLVLFKAYGLYDRDAKRISHSSVDDIPGLFHALVIGTLLTWGLFRLVGSEPLVLAEVIAFAAVCSLLLPSLRSLVRYLVRRSSAERTLLVGSEADVDVLARKLSAHPEYGLQAVGRLSGDVPLEDLPAIARDLDVDRLIVSGADHDVDRLVPLLRRAHRSGVKVGVVPVMFDILGPSVEVDHVEGVTVLALDSPVLPRSSRVLKRTMDIAGASLALLAAAPVMALIALAVKLDSRGPIFFRQRRMGRAETPFEVVKFRTMCVDAEARQAEMLAQSADPNWVKLDHDPRITRVGGFLRKTSLDELPQFWNVLIGEMSLVGPRPLIESEDRLIEDWGRARLDLTPGITGLWQVLGRTNIPFEEMVKLDYLYVTNWSMWNDVRLILQTLPAVLLRRGVN